MIGAVQWRTRFFGAMGVLCLIGVCALPVTAQEAGPQRALPVIESNKAPVEATQPDLAFTRPNRDAELVRATLPKVEEVIRGLDDLLSDTAQDEPERATLLFERAEMTWKKARLLERRAFTHPNIDSKAARRDLALSDAARGEAVRFYKTLVDEHPGSNLHEDAVFYMAENLMVLDRDNEAQRALLILLRVHPTSRHAAIGSVNLGDILFGRGDLKQAAKAYSKALSHSDLTLKGYANYKLAWCHYNLGDHPLATKYFIDAIDAAHKKGAGPLKRESIKGLTLTYAQFGQPTRALPFLKKAINDRELVDQAADRLARLYADEGKNVEAIALYRLLIMRHSGHFRVVGYQIEIARTIRAMDDPQKAARALLRACALLKTAQSWQSADPKALASTRSDLELLLAQTATEWHHTARVTRNQDYLKLTSTLYDAYLDTFPTSSRHLEMRFFHAEALRDLGEHSLALKRYGEVSRHPSPYTKDALYNVVQLLTRTLPAPASAKGDTKPIPLSNDDARFIAACDNLVKAAPDDPAVDRIKLLAARRLYDLNHLTEASARFEDIVRVHPNTPTARIAANLHLDALNLQKDLDALSVAIETYRIYLDPRSGLPEQIAFARCRAKQEGRSWSEASRCYKDFAQSFGASDKLDKALYNAAICHERLGEVQHAISTRIEILKQRPDSDLVTTVLWEIGEGYQRVAAYGPASRFYELLFETDPSHTRAGQSLLIAATYRRGLGEHTQAIKNYEGYLGRYCGQSPRCNEVVYQLASVHESVGNPPLAATFYRRYLALPQTRADRRLMASTRLGVIAMEAGQHKKAAAAFSNTLAIYAGLSKAQRAGLGEGADAAAQARFMQAEQKLDETRAISLSLPESVLKQRLGGKVAGYNDALSIYEDVLTFGQVRWSVAALHQMGSMFEHFATEVLDAPTPPHLKNVYRDTYRRGVEDLATRFEEKAIDAFETCLDVARRRDWFGDYTRRASKSLARLDPEHHRAPSELHNAPDRGRDSLKSVPFTRSACGMHGEK